jgi:FkbM family methyltransferase
MEYPQKFIEHIHQKGIVSGLLTAKKFTEREIYKKMPHSVLLVIYPLYSFFKSEMTVGIVRPRGDIYEVIPYDGTTFYIPTLSRDLFTLSELKSGNPPESIDHNMCKYLSYDSADVCADDKVIDVGAFIGAVSIGIAKQGAEVIAVEPSERNAECIRRNAIEFDVTDLVTVVQKPVYSNQTTMDLNLSEDPTDNSLITTDTSQIKIEKVETTTIDLLAAKYNFSQIDLLKMDAEGVEPEVWEGVSETPIKQVSIDCSAERNGQATFDELHKIATQRGYKTTRADNEVGWDVMYGRRSFEECCS